jgi:preprotein translocase subunit SecF
VPFEIVNPDTHIDFIGKRHLAGALSAALLLASVIAIPLRGIQVGIDFAGGTELQVRFDPGVHADEGRLREVVGGLEGIEGLSVVRYGDVGADRKEFLIKFQGGEIESPAEAAVDAAEVEGDAASEAEAETSEAGHSDVVVQISQAIAGAIGPHSLERVEFVGPRWAPSCATTA